MILGNRLATSAMPPRTLAAGTLVMALMMALGVCFATPARAQSMDYGALEQLFGEPVTTSATGSPQRVTDVPANMDIITADDIRRSGADNIPDVLQFVAGVDVRRYGFADAEISVRGYNQPGSPRLLVLINGRQVYLDDYGRTAWQALPVRMSEIRQIEVVKGPNSALFGFNAIGGVINIITYDPLLDSTNLVAVRTGTQGYVSGSAVTTLHDGDEAGLRLSIGGSRANEFSTANLPAALGPYNNSPYQVAFSADGSLKVTNNVVLSAALNVTEARNFDILPSPSLADDTYRTNSLKLGIAADTQLGLLNFTAYRNELNFIARTSRQRFASNNTVYVLQANDLFKVGDDHTFRFGLEYRDNFNSGPNFGGKIGYHVYAASAMWSWQINPELTFTNAVRFDYLTLNFAGAPAIGSRFTPADYNSAHLSEPSFNSGFVYKPTGDDTLRLLVARGIQAPSLTDFGLQLNNTISGVPLTFSGNPNLQAASVMNYEVDYDRAVALIGAVLRTAIYYQRTDNLLTSPVNAPLALGPTGLTGYSQNIGSSSAAGGEIGLKGTSESGVRWKISYALISITDHLSIGPLGGTSSVFDFRHGAPAGVVDLGIGYSWDKFEVDAQARWQSHFTDYYPTVTGINAPVQIENHITTNARIGYHVTDDVALAMVGEQLTQPRTLEAAGVPVERRITVAITAAL